MAQSVAPGSSPWLTCKSHGISSGQARDLVGADQLLPGMGADLLIADKAFDADERVITMLAGKNKAVVIPSKANRNIART